jgi:sporulation protein YlmC with PRC-barrel domain
MWKHSGLAFCLALVASSFAVGQQVVQEIQPAPAPGGPPSEIRRVSQILGANVRLQGEDTYGKVEDIVLDENGTVQYLVVSKGDRYVMMPYNAANVDYGQRVVMYDVTPQAIQPLFFERNAWPTLSDPQYTTRIRQIFPRAGAVRGRFAPPVGRPAVPPGGAVIQEKVKIRPNGDVKVKEKVKEVVT